MPPPGEHQILTDDEFGRLLLHLKVVYARKRHGSAFTNLAVLRLLSLGLRSCEVAWLNVEDLVGGPDPTLDIVRTKRDSNGKMRPRTLQLLRWDPYGMADLLAFRNFRVKKQGARRKSPLVGCQRPNRFGLRLRPPAINARCMGFVKKVLGPERAAQLKGSHLFRRTFVNHAQRKDRLVVEVMTAVGHADLKTTTGYTVPLVREGLPPLWGDPTAGLSLEDLATYDTVSQKFRGPVLVETTHAAFEHKAGSGETQDQPAAGAPLTG